MRLDNPFYIESYSKGRILKALVVLRKYKEIFTVEEVLMHSSLPYRIKVSTDIPEKAREIIWSKLNPITEYRWGYNRTRIYGYLV